MENMLQNNSSGVIPPDTQTKNMCAHNKNDKICAQMWHWLGWTAGRTISFSFPSCSSPIFQTLIMATDCHTFRKNKKEPCLEDMLRTDRSSWHIITCRDNDTVSVKGSENTMLLATQPVSLFFYFLLSALPWGGVIFLAGKVLQPEPPGLPLSLLWDIQVCIPGQDLWQWRVLLPASSSELVTEVQTCLLLSPCRGDQRRRSSKHPSFSWLVQWALHWGLKLEWMTREKNSMATTSGHIPHASPCKH